jgi:hypothetical protein
MPKSPDAEYELPQADEALAVGALGRALGAAWRATAAAAQLGDEETLDALVEVVSTLEQQTTGHDHEDAQQLRVYVEACREDAQNGTRPPNPLERLLRRDRRSG